MQISVKLLNGRILKTDCEPTDKIIDLKNRLAEIEGIPPVQQRIVFAGRQLADDKTLQECNVNSNSTLNLLLALRGGH